MQSITFPDAVASAAPPEAAAHVGTAAEDPPRAAAGPPRQTHLFGGPKVIPFDTLISTRRAPRKRDAGPRKGQAEAPAPQAALDFRPPSNPVERVEYEYGDIAAVSHRAKAAVLDLTFAVAGAGLFALTFYLLGGRFSVAKHALTGWAIAATLLGFAYHLFFAGLGRDTPGMSACGLHVLTFDSARPECGQRIARLLVACLSVMALGLGLLWALFDEEGLTWHDHITKTYPAKRS